MDAAAPSTLRATPRRVSKSLREQMARVFGWLRSLRLRRDIFSTVEVRPRCVMLFGPFKHVVVRSWFVFVIVRLAIIFAHRVIDKFIPHQNPPQIWMVIETHSIEIENFPLLIFRASINRSERG